MSNFGVPGNPYAPAGWTIPANIPLTEEAVRQFEQYLAIRWSQITEKPAFITGGEAALTALDGRVTTAEGEIDTAQSDIVSHGSRLTTTENRITANDLLILNHLGRIGALETKTTQVPTDGVLVPTDSRTITNIASYLSNNKVFCPLDYGAVADGTTDDSAAIQACLLAARAWSSSVPATAGYVDPTAKIPVVDLRGRSYATDAQIEVPGGQGMTIQNGQLHAGAGFTSGMYLLHIGSTSDAAMQDTFRNVNSTIRNIYFDNHHVGGGLLVEKFMRLKVESCVFAHYATVGLKTGTNDSHEMFVTNCQFGEYFWGETDGVGYDNPNLFVGTGIEINAADNHISNCVIQLSMKGMKVNAQANIFDKVHIWTGYVKTGVAGPTATLSYMSTGLHITASGSFNTFTQMYIDGCEVLWETPWKTSFTNSIFLHGWGDASRAFIRLKPMAAGSFVNGVVIAGNSFQVQNSGLMKMTSIDTTSGTFSGGNVSNCFVGNNNSTGVTLTYTTVKMSLSQSAASAWVFTLTDMLTFGNTIMQCMFSVYHWGGGTQLFRLTNITGAVVTVNSYSASSAGTLSANNATVYIEATINKTH
jgi:hypothetical protein